MKITLKLWFKHPKKFHINFSNICALYNSIQILLKVRQQFITINNGKVNATLAQNLSFTWNLVKFFSLVPYGNHKTLTKKLTFVGTIYQKYLPMIGGTKNFHGN